MGEGKPARRRLLAVGTKAKVLLALAAKALPTASVMPEPAAVSVRVYVPVVPVREDRLPSVQVMLSVMVSVWAAVSRLLPPLCVSCRSATSKPVTASLKVIVIWLTAVFRGLGVTL